jgi:hypothetical protein
LLGDVKKNCHLLTRQKILETLGYPYDYESEMAKLRKSGRSGGDFVKCACSEEMHGRIDALAGVNKSARAPTDAVRPAVIDLAERRLCQCQEICTYVDKFLAHPATAESRLEKEADKIKLTLRKISNAHRILCQSAAFVANSILGQCFGQFLVTSARDVFENLTVPLASEEAVPQLRAEWDRYKRDTEEWAKWDWQSQASL